MRSPLELDDPNVVPGTYRLVNETDPGAVADETKVIDIPRESSGQLEELTKAVKLLESGGARNPRIENLALQIVAGGNRLSAAAKRVLNLSEHLTDGDMGRYLARRMAFNRSLAEGGDVNNRLDRFKAIMTTANLALVLKSTEFPKGYEKLGYLLRLTSAFAILSYGLVAWDGWEQAKEGVQGMGPAAEDVKDAILGVGTLHFDQINWAGLVDWGNVQLPNFDLSRLVTVRPLDVTLGDLNPFNPGALEAAQKIVDWLQSAPVIAHPEEIPVYGQAIIDETIRPAVERSIQSTLGPVFAEYVPGLQRAALGFFDETHKTIDGGMRALVAGGGAGTLLWLINPLRPITMRSSTPVRTADFVDSVNAGLPA